MSQAPGRRPPRTRTPPTRSGAGSRSLQPDGTPRAAARPATSGSRPASARPAGPRPAGATASGPGRRARTSAGPAVGHPVPQGRKPHQSKLIRQIFVLGLVLAAVALSLAYPFRDYLNQREELASATAEQYELEQTVAALNEQQAALSDPDYIRAEAKKRLQYVTPGDTVYVVQAPVAPATEAAGTAPVEATRMPWYSTLWGTLSDPTGAVDPAPASSTGTEPAVTPTAPAATPTAPADEYGQPQSTETVQATPTSGTGG